MCICHQGSAEIGVRAADQLEALAGVARVTHDASADFQHHYAHSDRRRARLRRYATHARLRVARHTLHNVLPPLSHELTRRNYPKTKNGFAASCGSWNARHGRLLAGTAPETARRLTCARLTPIHSFLHDKSNVRSSYYLKHRDLNSKCRASASTGPASSRTETYALASTVGTISDLTVSAGSMC